MIWDSSYFNVNGYRFFILMFTTASRPDLSSFRLLPGALSLKINCPEHQACHSSSYGVEVICGVFASTFHMCLWFDA